MGWFSKAARRNAKREGKKEKSGGKKGSLRPCAGVGTV